MSLARVTRLSYAPEKESDAGVWQSYEYIIIDRKLFPAIGCVWFPEQSLSARIESDGGV